MAQLRLVEPTIDSYGSRRAWKRRCRERRGSAWGQEFSPVVVAVASLVVLALIVLAVLLFTQVAGALVG